MAGFDNIQDTLASAGKFVQQKAKDVSGFAKLSIDLKTKEAYVDARYKELGKAYYEAHKDDENPEYDVVLLIGEAKTQIDEIKQQLINIKGANVCPSCGHQVDEDDAFCPKCGTKIERAADEDITSDDFFEDDEK